MVTALTRLLTVAEAAARAAQAVQTLRRTGNGQAADVLQAECNRLCAAITSAARRRTTARNRARRQPRGVGGTFIR